jgi:DNA-binding NarL/FixJ family response regulator
MNTRLLLVDDQRLVRAGICMMIRGQKDMQVVGEADDGREAVEMTRDLSPDIVLMDITMPGLNGIDATRQITAMERSPKVIAVSGHTDRRFVADVLRAGAVGYLAKEAPPEELMLAIRTVMQNKVYLSPQIADTVLDDYRRFVPGSSSPEFANLSEREREVLQLMAEGKNTKQIASALHVGKKTVDTHRAHIMAKLNASSVADLVKHAIREGLTSVDP